jgi:hypothetical protein
MENSVGGLIKAGNGDYLCVKRLPSAIVVIGDLCDSLNMILGFQDEHCLGIS